MHLATIANTMTQLWPLGTAYIHSNAATGSTHLAVLLLRWLLSCATLQLVHGPAFALTCLIAEIRATGAFEPDCHILPLAHAAAWDLRRLVCHMLMHLRHKEALKQRDAKNIIVTAKWMHLRHKEVLKQRDANTITITARWMRMACCGLQMCASNVRWSIWLSDKAHCTA